jgi:hypothetical protein
MVEKLLCVLCALRYVVGTIVFLLYNVLLFFFHSSSMFFFKKKTKLCTMW